MSRLSQVILLALLAATPQGATTLTFSTYLGGGSYDSLRDVAIDAAGYVYVVGGTASSAFPRTFGPAFDTGACPTLGSGGRMDVFVTKLSPAGAVVWSRLLGGPCYDRAYAVELDAAGHVYVAGRAGAGFPTTPGALQAAFGGDSNVNALYGQQDGFVVKLDASGAVLWSTYFGGGDAGIIRDIAVDSAGSAYPVMQHVTGNQPHVTAGAFLTARAGGEDVVVAKLWPDGRLAWGSYYGGSGFEGQGTSIRVDAIGRPTVLTVSGSSDLPVRNAHQPARRRGLDFALATFEADGSALVFSTYLGGSADEGVETHHLELGPQGDIYVAGVVRSADFPTTPGAHQRVAGGGIDVGVARFAPDGRLLASTYFGGAGTDGTEGLAVDAAGDVVFFGATTTRTHPTAGAYQPALNGTAVDAYVVKLSADLSRCLYVTYFGGSGADEGRAVAVAPDGAVVIGGQTDSADFPMQNAVDALYGGGTDAFVASLRLPALGPTVERLDVTCRGLPARRRRPSSTAVRTGRTAVPRTSVGSPVGTNASRVAGDAAPTHTVDNPRADLDPEIIPAIGPSIVVARRPGFQTARVTPSSSAERAIDLAPRADGRVRITGATLRELIQLASALPLSRSGESDAGALGAMRDGVHAPPLRIVNAPSWVDSQRFDLEASAGAGNRPDDVREMLHALLEESFGLAARFTREPVEVLALVQSEQRGQPDGTPARANDLRASGASDVASGATPMSRLADTLTRITGQTVLDRTGDRSAHVEFQWPQAAAAAGAGYVDLASALESQLGLTLRPTRVDADVLTIERVAGHGLGLGMGLESPRSTLIPDP